MIDSVVFRSIHLHFGSDEICVLRLLHDNLSVNIIDKVLPNTRLIKEGKVCPIGH